jgi:Fe-S cluster assembly protein SufD
MGAREHYFARFAEQETGLAGAHLPWLREARQTALARFAELGLPTPRQEDWKYTSVAPIEKRAFQLQPPMAEELPSAWLGRLGELRLPGCYRLVFVNGRHVPALSDVTGLPAGVQVGSLAQALTVAPERIEARLAEFLATGGAAATNGFTALNAACWADGAYIDLAPGVTVEPPIQLLFLTTGAELATFPRNLIRAASGAQATVIEHYAGVEETAYLTDALTAIQVGEGARLTHAKLQQEGQRSFHIADTGVEQAAGSQFTSHSFALGGLLSRYELGTRFAGEDCVADLIGLYLGRGRQHLDHHTRVDHAKPRGTSREFYQGVLDGAARAVFNGKVVVRADAQQTDARQVNRNLLLSREAEVDTKPQLEIFADDVKCSHGATVGQLDPAQIHYLRSRGLDEAEARALLIYAFAGAVLDQVAVPPLRARLAGLILERLPEAVGRLLCDETRSTS